MAKKYKGKRIICIAISLLIIFSLIYKICGIYYAANDDISMQKILSGSYSGKIDAHAVYIKYVLGYLLTLFYKNINCQIDWYGIFMQGILFGCYGVLIDRMFTLTEKHTHKHRIRIVFLAVFLVIFFRVTIFFQYTVVAGIAGSTAIFLLITRKEHEKLGYDILFMVLYLLTYLIRSKVFWMIMPITGLALMKLFVMPAVWDVYHKQKIHLRVKKYIRPVTFMCMVMLFVISIRKIDSIAYSSEAWNQYRTYNSFRSQIVDYAGFPDYDSNQQFYTDLGISAQEYDCLESMFGILPNIDMEVMGKIAEQSRLEVEQLNIESRISNMANVLKICLTSKICRELHIVFILILFGFLRSIGKYKKQEKYIIAAGIIAQLFVLIYLLWKGRVPDRIVQIFEIECILSMLAILLCNLNGESQREKRKIYSGLLLLFASIIIITFYNVRMQAETYQESILVQKEFNDYINNKNENVYVVQTGTVETVKQFDFQSAQGVTNQRGTRGWSSNSPFLNAKMEYLGIDLEMPLLLEQNVYYVTKDLTMADHLNEYYQSIYEECEDYHITDEVVLADGNRIYICKW